jgi:UV excision repair protein RAD23
MTHEQVMQIQQRLASMSDGDRNALIAHMSATLGPDAAAVLGLLGGSAPGIAGLPPGAAVPPGATVVSLTADEAAAVERLVSMGFAKQRVLEAYLACGKNEELAANFLMDNI